MIKKFVGGLTECRSWPVYVDLSIPENRKALASGAIPPGAEPTGIEPLIYLKPMGWAENPGTGGSGVPKLPPGWKKPD